MASSDPQGGVVSSAIQLADLGLVWSNATSDGDLLILDSDLASDRGIVTAVLLSLFLDARAKDDDVPPSGDPKDRRGWWADQFADIAGDRYGSRLWLLDRSTRTNENALKAKEYVREALAWMLADQVVSSIDVDVELSDAPSGLLIEIDLQRPSGDLVSLKFAHVWDHLQEDL